jgi:hypothetical protein
MDVNHISLWTTSPLSVKHNLSLEYPRGAFPRNGLDERFWLGGRNISEKSETKKEKKK